MSFLVAKHIHLGDFFSQKIFTNFSKILAWEVLYYRRPEWEHEFYHRKINRLYGAHDWWVTLERCHCSEEVGLMTVFNSSVYVKKEITNLPKRSIWMQIKEATRK